MGSRLKPVSTQGAKKSRKEETGLQHRKELSEEEEEEAAVVSGPSSQAEQRKALQPVKMRWGSLGRREPGEVLWVPPIAEVHPQRPFLTWLLGMAS